MHAKSGSRLDANREVRRIFVRHGVDTSKIQFSCQGKSLQLSGSLLKEGGHDLESNIVEAISQELSRLGIRIISDLDNWSIIEGTISKKGPKQQDASKGNTQKGSEAKAPANKLAIVKS